MAFVITAWQTASITAAPPETPREDSGVPKLLPLEPAAQKQFLPLEKLKGTTSAEPQAQADPAEASPGYAMPDLRRLHQNLPKAVQSIRDMLLPVISPAQPSEELDEPIEEKVEPAPLLNAGDTGLLPPVEVNPWRDPTIHLPLPLSKTLPALERMPLISYKPDTRNQSELYRVTDEPPSAIQNLPALEPPTMVPPAQAAQATTFNWPKTPQLDAMLKRLDSYPETKAWAASVKTLVGQLRKNSTIGTNQATAYLQQLEEVTAEAVPMVEHLSLGWERTDLTQTYYALIRRLDLWNQAHAIILSGAPRYASPMTLGDLRQRLEAAETILRDGGQLLSWSDYLRFKQLHQAMDSNASPQEMQEVASQVLARLEGTEFDEAQKELLSQPAFLNLAESLRPWLGIEFNPEQTLAVIERYEYQESAVDARQIAQEANLLQHHAQPEIVEYGQLIDHTYRNANARFEVSQNFMQAFMPELSPEDEAVDDFILGARVRGRSRSVTRLHVRPVPDNQQWRVQLEVLGAVDSRTSSHSGPVTIFNRGRSRYHAAKQVVVNAKGFWVSPAVAKAETTTSVDDLQSDFDGIPLIGSLVRNVARGQTEEKKYAAEAEVETRVRRRAETELNDQLNTKVQQWQDKLYVNVIEPLVRVGLEPSIVDLNTGNRSIAGRFRGAGTKQLAAHTPRPSSPIDSVLSVQLHQSGINNMIRQLRLGGRELTPHEFLREISTRFPAIRQQADDELPTEVRFTFDAHDPIRVEFRDGQAQLTLRLDSLQVGDNTWEDLEVSALYSPTSMDWDAKIVRESTVFLKGKRLGFRDQIALRAVFLKVLSKKHEIPLFPEGAGSDERLTTFGINQLALHEGWMAVSLGPKATRQASAVNDYRVSDEPENTAR
ncbi:hypothetical protein DTL21_17850 [Bremerella cremea]|uniref:Uncharacterized protein n=1 Tax=Blastopirellula marina TaxID=124 RepID=A0A2S8FIS7_9BACT|nr:hypothetical protein C5Y83_17835 [Blastopirellula marina]RCS45165.1 hypothetical protein DTL21_17850 [Bremerella cremea]